MRNFAVTGMPYRAAAPTAAATMAREQRRAGRHGRATTLARDLGGRAAEVEVDVVDEAVAADAVDGPAHHLGIGAVELQAARHLVGAERIIVVGLGVAVHDRGRHHHLVDVHQPGPEPPAQGAERRVRHAGHRGQHHRRRRHEVPDPHVHGGRRYRPRSPPCVNIVLDADAIVKVELTHDPTVLPRPPHRTRLRTGAGRRPRAPLGGVPPRRLRQRSGRQPDRPLRRPGAAIGRAVEPDRRGDGRQQAGRPAAVGPPVGHQPDHRRANRSAASPIAPDRC